MGQEIKVVYEQVTYLVDVSKSGEVDVYHTILNGAASGSYAGFAVMEDGRLVGKDSKTLTSEVWGAIEMALIPQNAVSSQDQLLLDLGKP